MLLRSTWLGRAQRGRPTALLLYRGTARIAYPRRRTHAIALGQQTGTYVLLVLSVVHVETWTGSRNAGRGYRGVDIPKSVNIVHLGVVCFAEPFFGVNKRRVGPSCRFPREGSGRQELAIFGSVQGWAAPNGGYALWVQTFIQVLALAAADRD